MIDSRAYSYPINANSISPEEDGAVHQSSPTWVLTFISWEYRDTLRVKLLQGATQQNANLTNLKAVLDPLVVVNDCINVSTTSGKSSYTPTMNAVLVQTDVNYLTRIAPGDFVFVNMLNWESDADRVASQARNLQAINGINDGFKGIFKVNSVRRTVTTTLDGKKSVRFNIDGYAFTEFNNAIYYDPNVTLQNPSDFDFMSKFAQLWINLVSTNGVLPVQRMIRILCETFLGRGVSITTSDANAYNTQSNIFFMPASVGQLLGIAQPVTAAKDIYNLILGIQNYNNNNSSEPYQGLNPAGLTNTIGRTWEMPAAYNCPGNTLLKGEYWNQVKVWDILTQYINRPINELFTCFRADPGQNNIMPTVVFRQMPFTTEDFVLTGPNVNSTAKTTRFMTIPRWKIDSAMVLSEDIGRDESLRVNFVQLFGKTLQGTSEGDDYTAESQRGNYVFERNDIQRSGLRPIVQNSTFDIFPEGGQVGYNSVTWARIFGDQVIDGHLRLSGHLNCIGIVDPIPVGDNLEYNGIVYHIEQVLHTCSIDGNSGTKTFRTVLSLSHGVSIGSNNEYGTVYAQMDNPNAYAEREVDYSNNAILPGVAESQDIPSRPNLDNTASVPNTSFPQPKSIVLYPSKKKTVK